MKAGKKRSGLRNLTFTSCNFEQKEECIRAPSRGIGRSDTTALPAVLASFTEHILCAGGKQNPGFPVLQPLCRAADAGRILSSAPKTCGSLEGSRCSRERCKEPWQSKAEGSLLLQPSMDASPVQDGSCGEVSPLLLCGVLFFPVDRSCGGSEQLYCGGF